MDMAVRTRIATWASLFLGLSALGLAVAALSAPHDLLLIGVLGLALPGIVLGIFATRAVNRSNGQLVGNGFAGWATLVSSLSLALGFLILPVVENVRDAADRVGRT